MTTRWKRIALAAFALWMATWTPAPGGGSVPPAGAEAAPAPELKIEPTEFQAGREKVAAEIGRFRVPENRSKPGGRSIELAFVRFRSTAERPGPPIVYLAGGPGGSGTGAARGSRFPLFMAMREFGDVIAFDQRGTGMSEPDLGCPNTIDLPLDRALTRAERGSFAAAAASACAESLRARGHDLSGYHSNASADDLESLRRAIGAEKLVLWGISYGTHLALATMKQHPESVDRVILAGLEGLHHTYKLPSDQQRLIETIGTLAASDSTTARALPDLVGSVSRLLQRLEREPVSLDLVDPQTGKPGRIVVGPFDLQRALANMLQGPESFAAMPDFVSRLEGGDWMALALAAAAERIGQRLNGMSLAMDCASGRSPEWARRIEREAGGALIADAINWPFPEVCRDIGVPDAGDAFRSPVRSSIPALLISGTLDGRTPPENAAEVAAGLSRHQSLVIEGAGHSDPLFLSSPKILEAMQAFLRGESIPTRRIVLERPVRFVAPRTVVALADAEMDRVCGSYRLGPTEIRVVRAGSLLFAKVGSRTLPLRPESPTRWFIEGFPTVVRFQAGDGGAITALEVVTGEGAPQRASRIP